MAVAGALAAAPRSGLPWPRFPSPFIELDVRIFRIRLSGQQCEGRRSAVLPLLMLWTAPATGIAMCHKFVCLCRAA